MVYVMQVCTVLSFPYLDLSRAKKQKVHMLIHKSLCASCPA